MQYPWNMWGAGSYISPMGRTELSAKAIGLDQGDNCNEGINELSNQNIGGQMSQNTQLQGNWITGPTLYQDPANIAAGLGQQLAYQGANPAMFAGYGAPAGIPSANFQLSQMQGQPQILPIQNQIALQQEYRLDPRIILEELRKAGRGLQLAAEEIESQDSSVRQKAKVEATRYLYYSLGLLFSKGIFLTQDIKPFEPGDKSTSKSISLKAVGVALEKYVRQQSSGRGISTDVSDLTNKLRDCWDSLK